MLSKCVFVLRGLVNLTPCVVWLITCIYYIISHLACERSSVNYEPHNWKIGKCMVNF